MRAGRRLRAHVRVVRGGSAPLFAWPFATGVPGLLLVGKPGWASTHSLVLVRVRAARAKAGWARTYVSGTFLSFFL
eukprot:COSAG01_NODE_5682_length_4103_cov_3.596903_3_plen_76_part_00